MKRVMIALLVAGQIAALPATAAPVDEHGFRTVEVGSFAGARFRLPLGRSASAKPRLDLAFAPMARGQSMSGRTRMSFGDGIGIGIAGAGPVQLSLGGRPLSALGPHDAKMDERNAAGVSTLGTVAIVTGGLLLIAGGLLAYALIRRENECCE